MIKNKNAYLNLIVSSALLVCLLTACGGSQTESTQINTPNPTPTVLNPMPNPSPGPSPTPDPTPTPTPPKGNQTVFRVKQIQTDADNNGIFEYTNTRIYNAEGLLTSRDTIFIDDGISDIELLGYIFSDDTNTKIEYDIQNRVSAFSTSFEGTNYVANFVYASGMQVEELREVITVIDLPNEDLTFVTNTSYTADVLYSTYKTAISNSPSNLDVAQEFIFNNEKRLIEREVMGLGDSYKYEWDANGNVIARRAFTTIDGPLSDTHLYSYDQDNNLIEYSYKTEFPYSNPFIARFTYQNTEGVDLVNRIEIDEFADGSIDAVIAYEWEQAPCQQTLIFGNYLSTPLHANDVELPDEVQYGTGWGALNICVGNSH